MSNMLQVETTLEMVEKTYQKSLKNVASYRNVVNRPLTLTEKTLIGHLEEFEKQRLRYR